MTFSMEPPLSIVELKTGEIRMILVMEDPEHVKKIVDEADTRLVTFTRWQGGKHDDFSTRPDNVLSVRPNK
jgi:hypothetical protein